MTVVFLTRLFFPHIGGVEKHVMEIGKQMVKDGNNVIVITENHSWGNTESVEGIKVTRIEAGKNGKQKKFRIWKMLWKNRKLLESADIIHCHDVFFWYLPFRFLYFTKPVYITFHGYETKFPLSKKSIFIRKASEILSDGNICVGKYIQKWYGAKPTFITYGGVNKIKNPEFKNKNNKLKIIFIGRLEQDTGIPIYLKTLDILKNKKLDFSFEAYGNGSLEKSVNQYGTVHGFLENIPRLISSSDIVFASSYLSILEAMINKKSVFSVYDNPLKKDYLEMSPFAGFINITNSPENLALKIIDLEKNKNTVQKNILSAYNWADKQTWESVTQTYYKLWKINLK